MREVRFRVDIWVLLLAIFIAPNLMAAEAPSMDAEAYYNRGVSYGKKGEYDRAIADFTKALEINPRLAQAYYNRGVAYERKGEYDQAIADYTNALELSPSNDAYYQSLHKYMH